MVYGNKDLKGGKTFYGHFLNKAGGDVSETDSNSVAEINHNDKMVFLADYLKLPSLTKRRIKALKNILHDYVKIETQFYKDLFNLEKEYFNRYNVLFDKRASIISGETEPTDEEATWDYCQEDQLVEELKKQCFESVEGDVEVEDSSSCKGIPKFWLKVLLHASPTREMVTDKDQDILKHLKDVRVALNSDDSEMGFTLNFYFSENEYFNENILSKHYFFDNKPPSEDPLHYDGPQIVRTRGTPITWKPGKNVTIKIMKKVKKHKNRKETRTFTKTVKQDSFFNFFDPPHETLTDEDIDEFTAELLQEDFRIASFMREVMIPQAVLYFTGEAIESDDDIEEESDETDDSDDDDDSSGDTPHHPKDYRDRRGTSSKASDEKPECQQS